MRTNHKEQMILRFVPHCAIGGKRINKNNKSSLEVEACRTQEIECNFISIFWHIKKNF